MTAGKMNFSRYSAALRRHTLSIIGNKWNLLRCVHHLHVNKGKLDQKKKKPPKLKQISSLRKMKNIANFEHVG